MVHRALIVASALLFASCSSDDSEVCDDGRDNDQNQLVDCADSACAGAPCGPNGLVCAPDQTCTACSGNGSVAELGVEATCGDGADNDCDGRVDCDDTDCQPHGTEPGRPCNLQGHTCSAPDVLGRSGCGGVIEGGELPVLGSILLASAEHDVLGARGSGYQEQSLLTFEIRAADGRPYPAGLHVSFSHESQGDSFIGMPPLCTASSPGSPPICTAGGTTDAAGLVRVLLTSGRRFAVLSVRAEATAGGVTRHLVAGGFTVVGAKPNGAHFAVDCRPYNVPALTVHDCLYSRYAGTDRIVDCTATLGDRHGNLVAVPTLVSFRSEAGEIVPAVFTPPFDPHQTALIGQAVGLLDVYGAPLPFDVRPIDVGPSGAPLAHEVRVDNFDYGCGARTTNPRDGLVTVIALVQGEEGFVDENFNGRYDLGEPWIDLGEPFLDVDDDGVRDTDLNGDGVHDDGEWYLDLDESGSYSGPNGRWDESTVLWTEHRVLYTGYPIAFTRNIGGITNELFSRFYIEGEPPLPTPLAPEFVGTTSYGVFFTDQHLNPLGSLSSFEISALTGAVNPSLTRPTGTADSIGTSFTYMYCDTDQSDPLVRDGPWRTGNCADGPAEQACRSTPCYLAPEVGRTFAYGNHAVAAIRCATPGFDVVQVHATVDSVTTTFSIAGVCP